MNDPATLTGMPALRSNAARKPHFTESGRQRPATSPARRLGANRDRCTEAGLEAALVAAAKRGGAREREELVDAFCR